MRNEPGTKKALQDEVYQWTNVPVRILSGRADLDDVCVAQKCLGLLVVKPRDWKTTPTH